MCPYKKNDSGLLQDAECHENHGILLAAFKNCQLFCSLSIHGGTAVLKKELVGSLGARATAAAARKNPPGKPNSTSTRHCGCV